MKRPIDLPALAKMMRVNDTRFASDAVRGEWKRIYDDEVQRQKDQCATCLRCRDIESKSGQRKEATPDQNTAARKAHSDALTELKAHLESGVCKDQKLMGSGWIFDDYKPFNPDNAQDLKVYICLLIYSCVIC